MVEITENLKQIFKTVKEDVVRERLIERAAGKLKLKESLLRIDGNFQDKTEIQTESDQSLTPFNLIPHSGQELLKVIFVQKLSAINSAFSHPDAMDIFDPSVQSLLSSLFEIFSEPNQETAKKLAQDLLNSIDSSWKHAWKDAHHMKILSEPEALNSAFLAIKIQKESQRIKNIEEELIRSDDPDQRQILFEQLIAHRKQMSKPL